MCAWGAGAGREPASEGRRAAEEGARGGPGASCGRGPSCHPAAWGERVRFRPFRLTAVACPTLALGRASLRAGQLPWGAEDKRVLLGPTGSERGAT